MKFLSYKLTLVAVLAIFLASCAGDGKDKTKEPVAQVFTPVGTVWESQPKKQGYLLPYRQQKIEFKTADTLIFSYIKTFKCNTQGQDKMGDYGFVTEFKYTYDASKKEVKLADKFKYLFIQDPDGVGCVDVKTTEYKDTMFEISKILDTNLIKNLDANSTKIEVFAKNLSTGAEIPANEKELIKQK